MEVDNVLNEVGAVLSLGWGDREEGVPIPSEGKYE